MVCMEGVGACLTRELYIFFYCAAVIMALKLEEGEREREREARGCLY